MLQDNVNVFAEEPRKHKRFNYSGSLSDKTYGNISSGHSFTGLNLDCYDINSGHSLTLNNSKCENLNSGHSMNLVNIICKNINAGHTANLNDVNCEHVNANNVNFVKTNVNHNVHANCVNKLKNSSIIGTLTCNNDDLLIDNSTIKNIIIKSPINNLGNIISAVSNNYFSVTIGKHMWINGKEINNLNDKDKTQIITITNNSKVGNINFENKKGHVIVKKGGILQGSVTGGDIEYE